MQFGKGRLKKKRSTPKPNRQWGITKSYENVRMRLYELATGSSK